MTAGEARQLARAVAGAHGLLPAEIVPITGAGAVNHVFVVRSATDARVIRFALDRAREDVVDVETWALREAAACGIPSPGVVATGRLDGMSYQILEFVDGVPGTAQRSPRLWKILGEYARAVHAIPLTAAPDALFSRFGRDLPAAWRAHLAYNLDALSESDPLIRLGVYPADRQAELRHRISTLQGADLTFGLNHGDLSLRNLLVPEVGPPVLLDWGSASAGPSPVTDLAHLLKVQRFDGEPSADELAAFAGGYGIDLEPMTDLLEDVTVLGALDLVRWAIDRRPDLLEGMVESSRSGIAAYDRRP